MSSIKLRQQHDDFRVEEITNVAPMPEGPFALYRLEKRGWTTPDAMSAVRRRWQVDFRRLSYGGLKDRHAHTIQHFTIHQGPPRSLEHGTFTVTYLGQFDRPYDSEDIVANQFRLVLRGMSTSASEAALAAIPEMATLGVPNYFDDQRFGSVTRDGQFVAKAMVLGEFEKALQIALMASYEHDRADAKREKSLLRQYWGDWPTAKAKLPRSHARSIVDYLVHHPTDFKGACLRLRPELQGLYLSAWQSHLWNRMLARWLSERLPAESLFRLRLKTMQGLVPRQMPDELKQEWLNLSLPLPSARLKLEPDSPLASVVNGIMEAEGVPLAEMRIKGTQNPFFSRGERQACVAVQDLRAEPGDDEMNANRRKITLDFRLPRGCYATMVVKRLTAVE